MAIILLLVLGLCISQRMILTRKLKAASATAFGKDQVSFRHVSPSLIPPFADAGSHETSLNGTTRVPGTNQHSVAGSNPIWRRDLEPDWFKQQDIYRAEHDGLDSLDVNAILGNEGASTPRNSNANSEAHTASIDSTTETFNR